MKFKNSQSEYLQAGAIIALTHHEKINGSGYPNGLKVMIFIFLEELEAIADVFDTLTSFRPYKTSLGFEEMPNYFTRKKWQKSLIQN